MSLQHGCVVVGCQYSLGGLSVLNAGYTYIKALGFKSIKIYLTGNYKGDLNGSAEYPAQAWSAAPYANLTALAQDTEMAAILAEPQFTRIFITAMTFANGINNPWVNNADTPTMLANEQAEIQALATYLLQTYSNKDFFLQLWEGDWAYIGAFDATAWVPPYRAERYAAFIKARQTGIETARAAVKSSSRVFNVAEVNRVLDRNARRVHREVLPICQPDVVSLSLYEAINTWGTSQATALINIDTLMREVVRDVRAYYNAPRIIIGEYGWPEAEAGFQSLNLDVGGLITQVKTTAEALGITDALYWNLFDNSLPYRGYALYKADASLTGAGTYFTNNLP